MKSFLQLLFILLISSVSVSAQVPDPLQVVCEPVWQQNIFDLCIGSRGIALGDYNQNGLDEIIMGNERTWTVVEYSPEHQNYQVIAGSREYSYWLSSTIVADADNDGSVELIVKHDYWNIELYDLSTYNLKASFELEDIPWWSFGLACGDVDNDGMNELLVGHDEGVSFFRILDNACSPVYTIEESTGDIKIGDIDGDGINEIVLSSGSVFRIEDGAPQKIWDFLLNYNNGYKLELADIDNDNLPEIVCGFMGFKVFDGDTRMLKWQITLDSGIDCFTVGETGNGGLPELLYVENQWGDVKCLEATAGSELWFVENSDHGGTRIQIGDPDGDGNAEFFFGANCSSSGPDHFYVYQINNLSCEFTSVDDFGHYRAVKIADTDNDSRNELITMSRRSEFNGPGIISVYDAQTKALEWRTDDHFLGSYYWQMSGDMEIEDVDHDGDLEMVVVGNTFAGALAVINGRTHQVDTIKFYTSIGELEELTIADLNVDGIYEYITTDNYAGIYIIDSETLQVIKTIGDNSGYDFATPVAGNIDDDPNPELVYIQGDVYVMDGITEQTWVLSNGTSPFMSCSLFDCNNDGISEIIANSADGSFYMIDGRTRVMTLMIETGQTVSNFYPANLAGDYQPEIVYTYGKEINVLSLNGRRMVTQINDDSDFFYALTAVTDYDNNGHHEIFTGANYYVQQRNAEAFECINLTATVETEPSVCNLSNGRIEVFPGGGVEPYTYNWSTGQTTSFIEGQPAGNYDVTISDATGCTLEVETYIYQTMVIIDSIAELPDNPLTTECEGGITVFPSGGTPPYSIIVNNSPEPIAGTTISELCYGNYQIMITDVNGCFSFVHNVWIDTSLGLSEEESDTEFSLYPNPANSKAIIETKQYPAAGAYAEISSLQGKVISRLPLTGQRTTIDLTQLRKGMYIFTFYNGNSRQSVKMAIGN